MAKRKGGYTRAKDGKFSKVAGSGSGSSSKAKKPPGVGKKRVRSAAEKRLAKAVAVRNRRTGAGPRKRANVSQKAVRRERNKQALKRLGIALTPANIRAVAQLKKGGVARLPGGIVVRRGATGGYTATKPKRKSKTKASGFGKK